MGPICLGHDYVRNNIHRHPILSDLCMCFSDRGISMRSPHPHHDLKSLTVKQVASPGLHKALQELPRQNDHTMGIHKRRPIDMINQVDVAHQTYFVLGAFEQGNADSRLVVPGWVEHAVCFRVGVNLRRNLLGMDMPAAYKLTQVQPEPGRHHAWRGQLARRKSSMTPTALTIRAFASVMVMVRLARYH